MNRLIVVFVVAVMAAGGCAAWADGGEQQKPNFIFIFTDDQAPDTVGAWGHPQVKTPHLDRLSQQGVNFMYAYNPGSWSPAVCVPSRTMVNSGLSLWRAREAHDRDALEKFTFWSHAMRDAGYDTYMSGKWHLQVPVRQAYEFVSNPRPGMPNITRDAYNRPRDGVEDTWNPADRSRGGFWAGGKHWSEVLADDAEAFLRQAAERDKPFFMYLAFNAPHDPRQAPQQYIDMYPLEDIKPLENFKPRYPYANDIGAPHRLRDESLAPMPRTEHAVKVHRQEYYAITSHMDTQVGRIMEALEASGMAENTYVIFTSDHGLAVGRHGLFGKQNLYEHSVRVPFIIAGPGMEAGKRIDTRIYFQDVVPTVMELAGVPIPEHVEFRSLVPLLRDGTQEHYPAIYGAYLQVQRMVIEDDWKLIIYPRVPRLRLYNLCDDPHELNDLAAEARHAQRIRQLFTRLQQLQVELDDPLDLSDIARTLP